MGKNTRMEPVTSELRGRTSIISTEGIIFIGIPTWQLRRFFQQGNLRLIGTTHDDVFNTFINPQQEDIQTDPPYESWVVKTSKQLPRNWFERIFTEKITLGLGTPKERWKRFTSILDIPNLLPETLLKIIFCKHIKVDCQAPTNIIRRQAYRELSQLIAPTLMMVDIDNNPFVIQPELTPPTPNQLRHDQSFRLILDLIRYQPIIFLKTGVWLDFLGWAGLQRYLKGENTVVESLLTNFMYDSKEHRIRWIDPVAIDMRESTLAARRLYSTLVNPYVQREILLSIIFQFTIQQKYKLWLRFLKTQAQ